MDGEVRFEYVETLESGKKKVADSKISGYVWTLPKSEIESLTGLRQKVLFPLTQASEAFTVFTFFFI